MSDNKSYFNENILVKFDYPLGRSLCVVTGFMFIFYQGITMQKNSLVAMLAGAAFLLPLAAQAEGLYVTAALGQSLYDDVTLEDSSLKDAKPGSGSIAFGYKIDPTWDVEVGYIHFGDAKYSGNDGGVAVSYKLNTQTVYAAAVGKLPLTASLSGHGKLGLAVNHSEGEFSAVTDPATPPLSATETKATVLLGLGLAYQFTPTISGLLDYTYIGKPSDGDFKVSMVSLGLRYDF